MKITLTLTDRQARLIAHKIASDDPDAIRAEVQRHISALVETYAGSVAALEREALRDDPPTDMLVSDLNALLADREALIERALARS